MEVFNCSGEPGIIVLTFDDNKTLNVKFEYKMLISVEYTKSKLYHDAKQYDSCQPQFSSGGHEGLEADKQDKMDVNHDGFHNPRDLHSDNTTDIEVDPVENCSNIVTKKNKPSKKMIADALQVIADNSFCPKRSVGFEKNSQSSFFNESNHGGIVFESVKLEAAGVSSHQNFVKGGFEEQEAEELDSLGDDTEMCNLSCQICEKAFQTNEELINHGSIFITKEKCLVCQKEFASNANLLLHNYLEHKGTRKMCPVCPVCFMQFFDNLEVINHLKSSHTNEEVYKCCVCHTVFNDFSIFRKHLDNYKFKKICGKPSVHSRSRKARECTKRTHQKMKSCTVVIEKLSNVKQKSRISKKFPPKSSKLNRQKSDKGKRKLDTDLGKANKSYGALGQPYYNCEICHRLFKENWALRNHTKPHTLVDVCKKCGCKAYSRAEGLLHEYMRHSEDYKSDPTQGSKDIKCPLCKETFCSQEILNHIMSQHTKECPYVCCICDKPLENCESFTLHVTSHQMAFSDSDGDSQFSKVLTNISFKYSENDDRDKTVCRLCKVEFPTQKDFLYHCQTEKERKVCNICETTTFTEAGYIVHRYLSHGLSPDDQHSPFDQNCYVNFNQNHLQEQGDTGSKTLKCPCCSDNVATQDLFFHIVEVHTHESSFMCCACNNESSTVNEFVDHCNFHLGKKMYDSESAQCTRCNLRFDSRLSVTRHQSIWHKKFTCSLCQVSFANTILLEEHLESTHQNEAKSCSFCGKLFCDAASLAWHERHHYYQKKIPCTICGEILSSKRTLSFHMQVKHSDSNDLSHLRVLCTICGKMVAKSSIATHRASHSNDRTHDCSICNKSFKHRSKVLQHVTRVHMKHIKSFICDVCGKNCTTRYNLKIHMRIHSSVKAFSCSLCGQGFNYNQSLQAHIVKKHNSGPQSYTSL